jgi:hypothetical protein
MTYFKVVSRNFFETTEKNKYLIQNSRQFSQDSKRDPSTANVTTATSDTLPQFGHWRSIQWIKKLIFRGFL